MSTQAMARRRAYVKGRDDPECAATSESTKPNISAAPSAILMMLIGICAVTAARTCLEELGLQLARRDSDFDATHAQHLLRQLCTPWPRIAGSPAAEETTVALLLRELHDIAEVARGSGALLEMETHSGSGSFYNDFLDGHVQAYANITSVVARLSWPQSTGDALLLAAHYDSFPTSPGSSDNAVQVSAALGSLRALASRRTTHMHDVLVLLNGAEESVLIGAHSFAVGHRWARDYRAVLNLEAIGAGPPFVAFQLGPDAAWLAGALGTARGMRGTVIAHDLFQIPVR